VIAGLNGIVVKDYQTAICVAHRLPSDRQDFLTPP
jgi:hypothetical protein